MVFDSHKFEELYNQLPCGYHSLDENGNFVRINDVELQMLGYSREEVIGRNLTDFITPESLPTFQQNFPIFKQRGWVNDLELQMRCKDGTIVPVAVNATAIKDEAGNFLMSNSVVTKISDRQSDEKALRESEAKLRAFVSATSDIVYEMSSDWQEMVSLKGKDFIATTKNPRRDWIKEYIPETDKAQVRAAIEQAISTRSNFELEHRVIRIDGTVGWTFSRAIPLMNETGEIVKWFGTAKDITEQKQAEDVLRENQNQIQQQLAEIETIYQSAPIGLNVLDLDLRFVRINQTLAEINGLSVEAHLGRTVREVLPELADAAERVLQTILETGEPLLNVEIVGETPAQPGVQRTWLESFFPLKDGDRIIGISTVCQEITECKQSELVIQQQIVREHLLAEITQAIHQTLDVEIILQTTVDRVRQFLQTERVVIFRFHPDWSGKVTSESVASESISIVESGITDPCFEEKYVELYRQGRVSWVNDFHSSEVKLCYQELMAQFQVRANLVAPILQREHLWGLLIAHHCRAPRAWSAEEIELLQQLATQLGIAIQQAELYQKNAEQAALIDIASDAIFVRDLSNRILFWSQGAERMYGWDAEEVKGRIAHQLFAQESLSQLEIALHTTIEEGHWHGELKQLTKAGKEIIVSSRWTLMGDHQDNPQSILVVNTDITEKKQLEQQLLQAQRLESIGTLAGGVAHDLNNILTPILGMTQLLPLYNPDLNESSIEMLKIVRTSALRGADIVKQVLLFARGTETEWKLLSIVELIEETLKLIRQTFPKSIAIEDYIDPNLWLLEGDYTQLQQVLMNLCVNARDAMPDGGKLIISGSNVSLDQQYSVTDLNIEVGNYILITITDTGMGIPPETIERIFDPFFTTKETGRGTGLGLSTAIGIVKNHNGTIEVQSDRRTGTQFQVYLPAAEEAATTETIADETIPFGQGELILVVDDEISIREVTKATLEAYNYRVVTANDGLDAIAIYAQQSPEIALVLMDIMMPEMDGLTTMRILKRINPNVKLIATSGLASKAKVHTAELIGIKSFLVKPYTAEKLLLHLQEALLFK